MREDKEAMPGPDIVPIENLENGGILAEDLFSASGELLLKNGEALTPPVILWLKQMGVKEVPLVPEQTASSQDTQKLELHRTLDERFQRVLDQPLMRDIYNALLRLFSLEDAE